jgi:hypothetical protein
MTMGKNHHLTLAVDSMIATATNIDFIIINVSLDEGTFAFMHWMNSDNKKSITSDLGIYEMIQI